MTAVGLDVPSWLYWVKLRLQTATDVLLGKMHNNYLLEFEMTKCSLTADTLTEVFAFYSSLFSSFNIFFIIFWAENTSGWKPDAFKSQFNEARIS